MADYPYSSANAISFGNATGAGSIMDDTLDDATGGPGIDHAFEAYFNDFAQRQGGRLKPDTGGRLGWVFDAQGDFSGMSEDDVRQSARGHWQSMDQPGRDYYQGVANRMRNTAESIPGVTDLGGGHRMLNSRYGSGYAVSGAQPHAFGTGRVFDERGEVDLIGSRASGHTLHKIGAGGNIMPPASPAAAAAAIRAQQDRMMTGASHGLLGPQRPDGIQRGASAIGSRIGGMMSGIGGGLAGAASGIAHGALAAAQAARLHSGGGPLGPGVHGMARGVARPPGQVAGMGAGLGAGGAFGGGAGNHLAPGAHGMARGVARPPGPVSQLSSYNQGVSQHFQQANANASAAFRGGYSLPASGPGSATRTRYQSDSE